MRTVIWMDGVHALIFKAMGAAPSSHFLGQCDQLILREISKIGATRRQVLRL